MRQNPSFPAFETICKSMMALAYRGLASATLLILTACSGLPTATFSTTSGCGLSQWAEAWAQANISSVTWDGACKDGLASGNGTLVANMKSGNSMRFTGQMGLGKFKEGTYQRFDGWELSGEFIDGFFQKGTILRPDKSLFYQGSMILYQKLPNGGFIGYSDQRFDQGKLHLSDGSYVEDGRWDGSLGQYVLTQEAIKAARGVIWGKYYDANGTLLYRVVGGRRYADETSYAQAKNAYLKQEGLATERANQAYMAELQRKEEEDRRQALGALAAGLGTAGTSRDRINAVNNSLHGQSGSAPMQGAPQLAPQTSVGGAPELKKISLDGVQSRTDCIRLRYIDQPLPPSTVTSDRTIKDASQFNWEKQGSKNFRVLIAENTCDEQLVFYSLACSEQRMAYAYKGRPSEPGWRVGDFGGVAIHRTHGTTFPLVRLGKGGVTLILKLDDGSTDSGHRNSTATVLREVIYAAWPDSNWWGKGTWDSLSPAGRMLVRKDETTISKMKRDLINVEPKWSSTGSVGTPNDARKQGWKPCSAVDIHKTWADVR